MARVYQQRNSLQRNYASRRVKSVLSWGLPVTLFILGILLRRTSFSLRETRFGFAYPQTVDILVRVEWGIFAAVVVSIPVVIMMQRSRSEKNRILKHGIQGETNVLRLLQKLPDDFTVIPDVTIETGSGKSQLDFIVLHDNGIWVIESKHMNGKIVGTLTDEHWRQVKVGRGGSAYGRTFYNPTKQVGTHVYRLKQCLQHNHVRPIPWIQGVVYFSNPDVTIRVMSDHHHPVVFQEDKLLHYLQSDARRRQDASIRQNDIVHLFV